MESTWTDGACGRTFNAGTAGAKAEDVRQLARKILPQLKPSIIIVSVGANHFWIGDRGLPEFRAQYRKLIADLPEARLILIGVPNSNAATAYVKELAGQIGARFLPAAKGSMPDGVHLTPSDASRLRGSIQQACASLTDGQTKAVS
jgi:lysophospholipase L1-like esterase